jgi:hypothetical protein
MIGAAVTGAAMIGATLAPATANAEPQGYVNGEFDVGLVYGTFEEVGPNFTLLAGGTVEEFCPGDPGTAPVRVFFRNDGSVDLKVNDKDQPVFLYEQTIGDSFDWIDSVCTAASEGAAPIAPFASGTADLKVRISDPGDGPVDIFNSVNGELSASDGTRYRVRASADFVLGPFGPEGDPADFVSFDLTKIGR